MLGDKHMKRIMRYSIIIILSVIITFAVFFQNGSVKYPLDDCVTYFDDEARYQLMEIKDYHIQDLKKGSTIFTNVTGYAFYENVLYVEFNEFIGYDGESKYSNAQYEHLYGTYSLVNEEKVTHSTIDEFDTEAQSIFHNKKIMVRLDPNKSRWIRWLSEFIPLKYRK